MTTLHFLLLAVGALLMLLAAMKVEQQKVNFGWLGLLLWLVALQVASGK